MRSQPLSHETIETVVKLGIVMWLGAFVAGCTSFGPPPPTTGYRADVILRLTPPGAAEATTTRIVEFYDRSKRRREMRVEGEILVAIDRPDLFITWILHPTSKTFDERRISSLEAEIPAVPNPFGPRTRARFEELGMELLDGVQTRKFAVSGGEISGTAWTTEDHVPLKFLGTLLSKDRAHGVETLTELRVQVEVVYSKIVRDMQPAHLFGIPSNYAGFENRKQRKASSSSPLSPAEVEEVKRRLEEQKPPRRPF